MRIIVYTGKGGVGKTSVAAATFAAARRWMPFPGKADLPHLSRFS